MKKSLALLLVAALLIGCFAGCGGTAAPSGGATSGGATSGGTTDGGSSTGGDSGSGSGSGSTRDTVRIALGGDLTTLDPMMTFNGIDQIVGAAIMDTLVTFDTDSSILPNLATEWSVSDDGTKYTFKLRDDVYFHNGEKLTADDVVFSVERAIASPFLASDWGTYGKGAVAIDESTVEIELTQPFSAFLALCGKMLYVQNRKAFEVDAGGVEDQYNLNIPGTGPYKFVKYEPGIAVTLEANPDYFKGAPNIPNLIFRVIGDDNAKAVALEADDLDMVGIFTQVPSTTLPNFEANDNFTVAGHLTGKMYFMPINCQAPGYDNKLVRQAIAHAIDRDWVRQVMDEGQGEFANCSMLGPQTFGYSDSLTSYEYDVEKAKALLVEAGYPGGEGLDTMIATISEGRRAGTEAVQSCLKEIGINLEVNVLEASVYLAECRAGNFTTSLIQFQTNVDPALNDSFYTENMIGSVNYARYINKEMEARLDAAAQEAAVEKRRAMYPEIYEVFMEELPYIPLHYNIQNFVHNSKLDIGPVYPIVTTIRYENLKWVE